MSRPTKPVTRAKGEGVLVGERLPALAPRAATTARTRGTGRPYARGPPKRVPRAESAGGRPRLLSVVGCSSGFRAAAAAGRPRARPPPVTRHRREGTPGHPLPRRRLLRRHLLHRRQLKIRYSRPQSRRPSLTHQLMALTKSAKGTSGAGLPGASRGGTTVQRHPAGRGGARARPNGDGGWNQTEGVRG